MLKHTFCWYLPSTDEGRKDFAQTRLAEGCQEVSIKAFGDGGVRWLAKFPRPSWAAPQWDVSYLDDLAGLNVTFWGYPLPEVDSEFTAIVDVLRTHDSYEIILNPETEWRVSSPKNSFQNLAQANAYAAGWVARLKGLLYKEFGAVPKISFSSVPTWADFPYEGFAQACDVAYPQHYWPDNAFTPNDGETGDEAGEDEVEAHIRRSGRAMPCIPILTACGEYDDAGVIALAENALGDFPELDGFSSWESGNSAYQGAAIAHCYTLLDGLEGTETHPTEPGAFYFPQTGYSINHGFKDFWQASGEGVIRYGYPLTNEIQENGLTVQYFERARFEWHGDHVELGRIGAELLDSRRG